jgi:hypothetical protein
MTVEVYLAHRSPSGIILCAEEPFPSVAHDDRFPAPTRAVAMPAKVGEVTAVKTIHIDQLPSINDDSRVLTEVIIRRWTRRIRPSYVLQGLPERPRQCPFERLDVCGAREPGPLKRPRNLAAALPHKVTCLLGGKDYAPGRIHRARRSSFCTGREDEGGASAEQSESVNHVH